MLFRSKKICKIDTIPSLTAALSRTFYVLFLEIKYLKTYKIQKVAHFENIYFSSLFIDWF